MIIFRINTDSCFGVLRNNTGSLEGQVNEFLNMYRQVIDVPMICSWGKKNDFADGFLRCMGLGNSHSQ